MNRATPAGSTGPSSPVPWPTRTLAKVRNVLQAMKGHTAAMEAQPIATGHTECRKSDAAVAAVLPAAPRTPIRLRRPNWSPYRHAANSPRGGFPMRTRSSPPLWRAMPMFWVDARVRVARKMRSQSSTASQRSSSGVRFQRWHRRHTTQSRPLAASKASRLPTGKASTTSLVSRGPLQNMQVVYMPWQSVDEPA